MDERIENIGESARAMRENARVGARRLAESAQDVASRAGSYMQGQVGRVSERAQSLAEDANTRLEELTGRGVEGWAGEARGFIRDHPLQAIAMTMVLGFVLGKVMQGRD